MLDNAKRPDLKSGDAIDVRTVKASSSAENIYPVNLINGFGLSKEGRDAIHDNHNTGDTMWRTEPNPKEVSLVFDLGTIYPVGEMYVWNYNQFDDSSKGLYYNRRGLKNISIYHSLDGKVWNELRGKGYPYKLAIADGGNELKATNLDNGNMPISFDNISARFIKVTANPVPGIGNWGGAAENEAVFGLSAVKFFIGEGIYAVKVDEWTNLFRRYSGWTGSDGSYSIPYSGWEAPGNSEQTKTIFTFGDTFLGKVDKETYKRVGPWAFANNTMAILDGGNPHPEKIKFIWGKNGNYDLGAVFQPIEDNKSYYWLQDGIVIDGMLYLFTLVVGEDPSGPEGFKFSINDVAMMAMPIGHNGPEINKHVQLKTPLFYKSKDGKEEIFMCGAIMPNTIESGAPDPDGYIYVYGHKHANMDTHLVVSRVKPENFTKFDLWEYWNGRSWVDRIEDCAILASNISCEHSVTPIATGINKGKYLLIYQKYGTGREVMYSVGESPVGPFDPGNVIYIAPEPELGQAIYTYNAKAHPHLSQPGELLVSYNCNSRNGRALLDNGDIYHTRWICIKDSTYVGDGNL